MEYFFTADEHYGHKSIIKLCKRPFSSVEEMDEAIIERHNSVIKKDDEVIHLGDFTLEKRSIANAYLEKLNGNHVFIAGSHDPEV